MPNKQKDVAISSGKPSLRALAKAKGAPPPVPVPPEIFSDPRSGKDRRETRGEASDPRRVNGERRRSKRNPEWWLETSYVDAHHFAVKSANSKGNEKE